MLKSIIGLLSRNNPKAPPHALAPSSAHLQEGLLGDPSPPGVSGSASEAWTDLRLEPLDDDSIEDDVTFGAQALDESRKPKDPPVGAACAAAAVAGPHSFAPEAPVLGVSDAPLSNSPSLPNSPHVVETGPAADPASIHASGPSVPSVPSVPSRLPCGQTEVPGEISIPDSFEDPSVPRTQGVQEAQVAAKVAPESALEESDSKTDSNSESTPESFADLLLEDFSKADDDDGPLLLSMDLSEIDKIGGKLPDPGPGAEPGAEPGAVSGPAEPSAVKQDPSTATVDAETQHVTEEVAPRTQDALSGIDGLASASGSKTPVVRKKRVEAKGGEPAASDRVEKPKRVRRHSITGTAWRVSPSDIDAVAAKVHTYNVEEARLDNLTVARKRED